VGQDGGTTNEFGTRERFDTAPITAEDKVLIANGAGDAGTRGWVAALEARTARSFGGGTWYRSPAIPGARPGRIKITHGKPVAAVSGKQILRSCDRLTLWGTGNPVPQYDPQSRPGDNLYTDSVVALNIDTGKLAWHFQYTPNDSWDYDEVGVHMLYDTIIGGQNRRSSAISAAMDSFTLWIVRTESSSRAPQYVNDLNWTKGSIPRAASRLNTIRSWTCKSTIRSRARCVVTREADMPDLARRHRTPTSAYNPVSTSLTVWASKAASHKTALRMRSCRRTAASTQRTARNVRTIATSTTFGDGRSTRSTTRSSPRPSRTSKFDRAPQTRRAACCSPRCRTAGVVA